jgi:hypothetical protein
MFKPVHLFIRYVLKNQYICFKDMRNILPLILFFTASLKAQFSIQLPLINDVNHPITDTVYMSPGGNDANPGSMLKPVKTFAKALSLLPFGTVGIRGGHAYGLVMMLPGTYIAPVGFSQYLGDWQKGSTFKNVSVEGIGEVTIRGPKDSAASGHLLFLRGDNIYVKNLKLRKGKLIGLLMAGEADRHCHDIRIENVDTDSTGSFGLLIKNGDRIEISGAKVMFAAQYGGENLKSVCNWPSGLKLLGCSHFRVHDSRVGFSRGEGLNYQNSINGEAYNNILHDNSANYYNENSKNIIFRNNYLYNSTAGQSGYWRTCPADTGVKRTPCGILIANEGSCHNSVVGGTFENCRTKCIISSGNEYFYTVDSIFIFNNVMQNVGAALDLWEGSTQILGINCMKNVFFFNNTSIGYLGNSNSQQPIVNTHFPYYNPLINTYSRVENIKIYNNVFSVDKTMYPNLRAFLSNFGFGHPTPNAIDLSGNLWNFNSSNKTVSDSVNIQLPGSLPPIVNNNFNALVPAKTNLPFKKLAVPFAHVPAVDFYGKTRQINTNVGAFEFDPNLSTKQFQQTQKIYAFPNPASHTFSIAGCSQKITLSDLSGRILAVLTPYQSVYTLPQNVSGGTYLIFNEDSKPATAILQVLRK